MRPKFYVNYDNNRCLQCCVRMVHDSILNKQTNETEVDKETEYDSNLWTWTISGAKFLTEKLGEINIVNSGFDYQNFVYNGEGYLKSIWSVGEFNNEKVHASKDFKKEIRIAKNFLENGGIVKYQEFTENDIRKMADLNFLIAKVDPGRLYNGQSSADRHYVLIYKQQRGDVEIHDPGGRSPKSYYLIDLQVFISAFLKELIVIPKPSWWFSGQKIGRNELCPCNSGKKNKKCHDL